MRKLTIAAAMMAAATACHAQSSVTLYGLIDEAVRFQTGGNGNALSMSEGAINGNRWGLRGSEDLGGGLSAIFNLESGYNIATGKSDQQQQLFGRFAWVGLQSDRFGTLKLGRQYGAVYSFFAFTFDPIGGGNLPATEWSLFFTGSRFDDTVEYDNQFGPVALKLQRSLGGQPGSNSSGSTTAGSAIYAFNGGKVGVAGAESKDAQGHKLVVGSVGTLYTYGPFGLYLYGLDARRDAGFAVAAANSGGALANTGIINNLTTAAGPQTKARNDLNVHVGATWQPAADLVFTLSYSYDYAHNVTPGGNGTIQTVYGVADYLLSKRTDVYLEMDHTHLSGASVNDLNAPISFAGARNNFGAGLSLRTRF
ncbi:porin [Paraburkholderia caballeronis]|uniref:Outer membrane protein (Porin) n=1 Tax=Paraburkholderia caballeronis TaxID=416943 RepID=A0A1H7JB91_9BURK|nr:porin [Paraburkholderia caballeronis]PXW27513.1 putative porin [Paraburkholderia caballeronis]PXX02987.1 putative porin [Paraburkholderia caballeronis]RAK03712.1 putative porin [Paraburkholderia caballeronis]TDV06141.1 putative porin [Paraburkholderia caballeronis]TDV09681.1 putative porin [Paraburkholderia caballeronis]